MRPSARTTGLLGKVTVSSMLASLKLAWGNFYLDHFIYAICYGGHGGENTTTFVHMSLQNQHKIRAICCCFGLAIHCQTFTQL